jgi:adenine-specific DNA-methyltransferase
MTSKVYNEDVFETMKRIKTGSINLIICDSPYFKICGGFDWTFKTMQEWIDWHILLRDEFERIMADNGSLFVFGDEKNIAYLQIEFDKKFNLLNNIVYKKPSLWGQSGMSGLNSFATTTERILFYDKGENKTGLEMIKKIMPNPFAEYFKSEMMRYFKTIAEFRKFVVGILKMDSAMVNRWFEGDSIISKERYLFIKDYLNNEYLRKEYEDLRKEYEDLRRPFNNQFRLTDVIDAKLKSSFHPTTKDGAVIEKLILTTTKENDLIFSPFLGSGTDRIAAYNTKRNIISCELDKNYFDQAEHHYQEHIKQGSLF